MSMLVKLSLLAACLLLLLANVAFGSSSFNFHDLRKSKPHDTFDIIPQYKATLVGGEQSVYTGRCFLSYGANFTGDEKGGEIVFEVATHQGPLLCTDWFVFATREEIRFKGFSTSGLHRHRIDDWHEDEWDDVSRNGLAVFLIDEGALSALIDAFNGWRLFHGKRTAKQAQAEIESFMNFTYQARDPKDIIHLDPTTIRSGDMFAITRMDSTNMFIQIGTGSRVGHVALALWVNSELQVCEAVSDKHCDGQWPPPYGIICTPWERWMNLSISVDYLVSFLPLSDAARANFDEAVAIKFVQSVMGLPYGNHNFFYTWVDTPDSNYPPPLSSNAVEVGLPVLERTGHVPLSDPGSVYYMIIAGANLRLGTSCNDTGCLYEYLDAHNMSLSTVLAMPEQDSWRFEQGNRSLVCSSFIISTYKEAGVFGDLDFQATEAQPRDAYLVGVFADEWDKPGSCKGTPGAACQIMGALVLDLPDANTVTPHQDMFSNCPSLPPNYDRPASC